MSGLGSFVSSFFPTIHADAEEEKPADSASENPSEDTTPKEEDAEDKPETEAPSEEADEEEAPKEEEEEEEPEDVRHPAIRAACEARPDCAKLKHHFEHCQEKVESGKGFKGEDCVEEMYCVFHLAVRVEVLMDIRASMMHCSEACAAPRIFAKLR
ncbi:Non-heme 11 kDa protein of cytochrome bc1 complex [Mycena maculata]|uniref:Non-heme 11 kDa protein of cytochrome bc1 complex n=1 Tax=Mycena maculata TaxID=230809 RepID=A0AAD7NVL9_9AGAR|nr:Non-heme 11 kDa protein of cytochrome bc1 complex [Mycena maculata]